MDLKMTCKEVRGLQIPEGGGVIIAITMTATLLVSKPFLT